MLLFLFLLFIKLNMISLALLQGQIFKIQSRWNICYFTERFAIINSSWLFCFHGNDWAAVTSSPKSRFWKKHCLRAFLSPTLRVVWSSWGLVYPHDVYSLGCAPLHTEMTLVLHGSSFCMQQAEIFWWTAYIWILFLSCIIYFLAKIKV